MNVLWGGREYSYLRFLKLMKMVNHFLPIPKGFESRDETWYYDYFVEKSQRNAKEENTYCN